MRTFYGVHRMEAEAMTLNEKRVLAEMLGLTLHDGELYKFVPAPQSSGDCHDCACYEVKVQCPQAHTKVLACVETQGNFVKWITPTKN